MSKLYKKYLEEKRKDSNNLYLFRSGMFYIFLDEDAKKINSITTLKLTNLNNEVVKCGFPHKCLDKYLEIFENLNLSIKIIERENIEEISEEKIIDKIKKIDLNKITPIEAFEILKEIKEILNG